MMKLSDIKTMLRGPLRPGRYFVAADGEPLSFAAVRECWREICDAHIRGGKIRINSGPLPSDIVQWLLIGWQTNWDDPSTVCVHTSEPIELAED